MAQVRHAATRRLELITEINNNKWRAFLAPSFFVINTQFILNESFARRREHGHPLPLNRRRPRPRRPVESAASTHHSVSQLMSDN